MARKSERLMNLVICLLAATRYLTRDDIRRSVEGYAGLTDQAFERAFERDKEELRALGLPLEMGRADAWDGETDGYRIRRQDYELPPLDLTPAEATLVGLATRVWQGAALDSATGRAIAKLKAAGIPLAADRLVAVAPTLPTREPAFGPLWEAWLTRAPVRFSYHGKERVFEPWRLILRHGRWYAVGRDRTAGEVRLFKLSRIEDTPALVPGEPPFATVSAAELAGHVRRLDAPEPVAEALLAIKPDGAPALRRRGRRAEADTALDRLGDGYEVYSVPYARDDDLVAEAAAAGSDVLVLEPPGLRAAVIDRLRWVAAAAAPAGKGGLA
ncbi:MAG: WYL domain-containing protein [Propionibacteriaceae bacterium]|jgi:proteasome accessory factor B|nr:WYL domain-containing protein [Propionibacteriaceae bacterium]